MPDILYLNNLPCAPFEPSRDQIVAAIVSPLSRPDAESSLFTAARAACSACTLSSDGCD